MENGMMDWAYLNAITGNFEGMYQYYFQSLGGLGAAFRQTGVGLLYSIGLGWAGLCALKAPVDRALTAIGVLLMVGLVGFLMSPTTNNAHLSKDAAGKELAVGGYYSFLLTGTLVRAFDSTLINAWDSLLMDMAGKGGSVSEAVAIAYATQAEQAGEMFANTEGRQAFVDYQAKCGSEALRVASSDKDRILMAKVGIGANTLGMSTVEGNVLYQEFLVAKERGLINYATEQGVLAGASTRMLAAAKEVLTTDKSDAIQMLKNLKPENSTIDGTTGYRIPTKESYKNALGSDAPDTSATPEYVRLSSSSGELAQLHANGAKSTPKNTPQDQMFYPKNCYELYLVADAVMKNFRGGVEDNPAYANLKQAKAYASITAYNTARLALNDQLNERFKALGVDEKASAGFMETMADHAWAVSSTIGNKIDKWMLEFKIPTIISGMAMLVVILIVTFPIFGLLAVVFGADILWTYLKLMALPFLVVFINRLLLTAAVTVIMYNKYYTSVENAYQPGKPSKNAAFAAMNSETIIFLLICTCEIGLVMLLLWNDVKGSAGRMDFSKATSASAALGYRAVGAGTSFMSKIGKHKASNAKAARTALAADKQAVALGKISTGVSAIASKMYSPTKSTATTGGGMKFSGKLTPAKPSGGGTGPKGFTMRPSAQTAAAPTASAPSAPASSTTTAPATAQPKAAPSSNAGTASPAASAPRAPVAPSAPSAPVTTVKNTGGSTGTTPPPTNNSGKP